VGCLSVATNRGDKYEKKSERMRSKYRRNGGLLITTGSYGRSEYIFMTSGSSYGRSVTGSSFGRRCLTKRTNGSFGRSVGSLDKAVAYDSAPDYYP
jgi:hypothetical protein